MACRIVVTGGGAGGTVVSNRLVGGLKSEINDDDVRITLAPDSTKHVCKPVFLYVPFGITKLGDGVRDLRGLVDERMDIVTNHIRWVDTDEKCLYCQDDDERLGYNMLVLMTGAKLNPDAVPGFREGAYHFYNVDGAERFRDALVGFEDGRFMLSVVGTPHMYPATPLKFAFIVDDWLWSHGLREDIDLVYTYPMKRSHEKSRVTGWANPILAIRGIRVRTDLIVDTVGLGERVVLAESGAGVGYNLLVGTPPHRDDEPITDSDLSNVGWASVDRRAPHATAAEDVYTIGGTAALPVPGAESATHLQVFTIAERIAAKARGCVPAKRYGGKTICFVETGLDKASFVSLDYETPVTMCQLSRPVRWAGRACNGSYQLTVRRML